MKNEYISMKKIKLTILLSIVVSMGFAQSTVAKNYHYKTALGLKYTPWAFSIKQAVYKHQTLEALMYFYEGARLTALYEFHHNFEGSRSFHWYVGPGMHVQFNNVNLTNGGYNYIGLDAVLGLDWKIKNTPLNASIDWQPSFDFINTQNFKGGFGGLAIRYILQ